MVEEKFEDCIPTYVDITLWKELRQRVATYIKNYPTQQNSRRSRLLCELLYIYVTNKDVEFLAVENFINEPFNLSNLQIIELYKTVEDLKNEFTLKSNTTDTRPN